MLKMASSYGMLIIMSIYIICPLPELYARHLELHLSNPEDSFPLHPMPKPQNVAIYLTQAGQIDICKEHLLNTQ